MSATTTKTPGPWLGDAAFQARLVEFLVEPIHKAERYEEEAMPVRPLIAVYGHHQSDKAQVVKHFCDTQSISARVVTVRLGFTKEAVREIDQHILEIGESLSVLILDHADVLLLEPEHADSQLFALQLRDLAVKERILIVGCFDRVLNPRETDSVARACIRPWMHAICYLAPPPSTWIAPWLQAQLEGYVTRHADREGFELQIQRDEYTVLAQHCVCASYGHLVAWVRRIWYEAYKSGTRRLTKDWLQTPPLMSMRSGRLHILDEDVRTDEDRFSIAAGLGPVGAPPSMGPVAPTAHTGAVPRYMTELDPPEPEEPETESMLQRFNEPSQMINSGAAVEPE